MDDSTPPPEPTSQTEVDDEKAARRRNISWGLLWVVLFFPLWAFWIVVIGLPAGEFLSAKQILALSFIVAAVLAAIPAWRGIKRGRNTPSALRRGWVVASLAVVVLVAGLLGIRAIHMTSREKYVLGNIRQLSAAAEQYYLENAVRTCTFNDLVGPDKYMRAVTIEPGETYPRYFTQGVTITVTGVAGSRTVTYSP